MKLFVFRLTPFGRLRSGPYSRPGVPDDGEFYMEPPDLPPFLIGPGHLPSELRNEILENGFSLTTWDRVVEVGVDKLTWRIGTPLGHLGGRFEGGELVSHPVFEALVAIAPGSFYSRAVFRIARGQASSYHLLGINRFPMEDNDPSELDDRPTVIGPSCHPPFDGGYEESITALAQHNDAVIALPKWLDRSDKVILIGYSRLVTEDFVEQWRSTEISKHLRENNFEYDIQFSPWRPGGNKKYCWVDVD